MGARPQESGREKMKILPRWFLEEETRVTIPDDQVDYGYCVNCQVNDIWQLKLALLKKIRTVEIDCIRCGCKVGIFDMDIEEYRSWDISEKRVFDE